jgi:hypothetical protein
MKGGKGDFIKEDFSTPVYKMRHRIDELEYQAPEGRVEEGARGLSLAPNGKKVPDPYPLKVSLYKTTVAHEEDFFNPNLQNRFFKEGTPVFFRPIHAEVPPIYPVDLHG